MKIKQTSVSTFFKKVNGLGHRESELAFEALGRQINDFTWDCSQAYEDYPGFTVKDIKYHTFIEEGWTVFTALVIYEDEVEIDE